MGGIYWIASYPKSGNTWFRVFLSNLREDRDTPAEINRINNDGFSVRDRAWLDMVLGFDTAHMDMDEVDRVRPDAYRWCARQYDVTYQKVHDAYTHLPDGTPLLGGEAILGTIYILRNPLDVALSFAHHLQCSVDEAIDAMGNSDSTLNRSSRRRQLTVRERLLSWSEHVLSWIDSPGLNRHWIRYEDMLEDPMRTFTDAARFLGLSDNPDRVAKAIRFSDFNELRRQEAADGFREGEPDVVFFRQGRRDNWRGRLSEVQVARVVADHGLVMRRFGYI